MSLNFAANMQISRPDFWLLEFFIATELFSLIRNLCPST